MKILLKILTLTILIQPFNIHGQESITILPKWKVNDTKTVSIERHEIEVEDGSIVNDTIFHVVSEIKVLKDNPGTYEISILYENVAYRSAVDLYASLQEELKDYKNFTLLYEVDKKTGNCDLINWKETQSFMTTGIDQIQSIVDEKVPEMSFWITMAFAPIQEAFLSEDDTKAFMNEEFGFLLYPYGKTLNPNDTLIITDTSPNPFNPMENVTFTTQTFVTDLDQNSACKIHKHVIHDLSGYKEMMRSMATTMTEKMGQELTDEKKNEIESIDFAMTDETTIVFDKKTTWPLNATTIVTIKSNDPSKSAISTATTTATLK